MNASNTVPLARWLALGIPAALLGGAYLSQYAFGLYPCEMCLWQRWPHWAAVALAALAFVLKPARLFVALAAGGILTSGLIGLFHAGVEYGWWQGITSCAVTSAAVPGQSALDAIMNAPLVRCDEPAWTLLGISLAGYNFLISMLGGLTIFWLLLKDRIR